MLKIAMVEDEKEARESLGKLIKSYFDTRGAGDYTVNEFPNAVLFLSKQKADHDIVFMDIEMPDFDGLTAAKKLRETDPLALLVFVTNMRRYATKGYSVDALDFIVKPPTEKALFSVLDKARRVLASRIGCDIIIKTAHGMRRVSVSEIRYIEVNRHRLTIHLETDTFEAWGSLKDLEAQLPADKFSRCNIGYLVSLAHITGIDGEDVAVGDERLKISRPKRKEFLADVAAYFGSVR